MDTYRVQERVNVVRSLALAGSELMVVYDSGQTWGLFHDRYAFTACVSGESRVQYRGAQTHRAGESTMVLEPGETHCDIYVSKPCSFRVLFVEPDALARWASDLAAPAAFHYPQPFSTDPTLFRTLNRLCLSIERRHSVLEQQCLFAECLQAFGSRAGERVPTPRIRNGRKALERAKAYVQDRYDESFNLAQLAAVARLSRFHLVHAFTEHFGLPPHAYQIRVRVERARALLLKGISAAEVAASVGFADQSHFLRHFKRIMHMTPSTYAQA